MGNWNFELIAHGVSLLGSTAAVISTLYFWVVRVNCEKPNLQIQPLKPVEGSLMLPQENLAAYRAIQPSDQQAIASYWLDLAVVNHSILPNAILGVDAWIRSASGDWLKARADVWGDGKLPLNLPPQTTCGLTLELSVALKESLCGTSGRDREEKAVQALADGMPMTIRLNSVRETVFEFNLLGRPGDKVVRSPMRKKAA